MNPQGLVPTLKLEGGETLTQSLAILEYLDETIPTPAILPASAIERAYVRSIAQIIASDIHPLNNLRVLKFLSDELGSNDAQKKDWYQKWVIDGFTAFESQLGNSDKTGICCFGNTPGLADICLIPQVYNAKRFNINLSAFPTINRINDYCLTLDAFINAAPEAQTDCPD